MAIIRYLIRSLYYYRKQHMALFLGITVTATVLIGALIVGDSIRFSLKRMVDLRLGKTRFALTSGSRFMDAGLATKLNWRLQVPAAPVLLLKGIVIDPDSGTRINNASIIGMDSAFNTFNSQSLPVPANNEAIVGQNLATRLGLEVGDELLIRVESAGQIPVNSPFAQEPPPTIAMRHRVIAIATDDQLGRFSLGNEQTTPYNVFVSLEVLGQKLDLNGLSNTLLIGGEQNGMNPQNLMDSVKAAWGLKDLGLSLKDHSLPGMYDLVSNRVFIDTVVEQALTHNGFPHAEVITYMVNDISCNGNHTPYSFASAVSFPVGGISPGPDEVILNRWAADDLAAQKGDSVTLHFYEIGPLRNLRETSHRFIVRDIIPTNNHFADSTLMPDFQGMSEAGSCSEWDAGVPIDLKRIRDKDEDYWDDYRGTPKVLISLETGRRIWNNPFGKLTMMRFEESVTGKLALTNKLLTSLQPSSIGLQVMDVRQEGTRTVENAVDFTGLFLGMSFFIIVAGILLTVLLYALHMNMRAGESSLLSGLGFPVRTIIRLRWAETSIVILLGSLAGTAMGILYNKVLLAALNTIWNDMVRTDLLILHIKSVSLVAGVLITMLIALIPVYFVTARRTQPVASRLKDIPVPSLKSYRRIMLAGLLMLVVAVILVTVSLGAALLNNATLYLSSAGLVLAGMLMLFHGMLHRISETTGQGIPSIRHLSVMNLKRNPARSLSVIAMLAVGTFTVVLTGANRKTFYGAEQKRSSGTGGYLLWAETASPVTFDLNSTAAVERMIINTSEDLHNVKFRQFEALDGDDASCLNLNQVNQPRILAVDPAIFDEADAFSFVKVLPVIPDEQPWLGLDLAFNDSTIPAYVDQTVLQYSLQRKLGDTLVFRGESGTTMRLVLAASLNNTIFQGNILIADRHFRKFFPSSGGTRIMLVEAPQDRLEAVEAILSQSLVDYGITVTPTSERLANFKTVENTYLTVFMALSGLGFIIGTIGLGIVLLRNVYERKKELALLLSLGFSNRQVFSVVLIENLYLLIAGWGTGMVAALIGILPSLFSPSFDLQGGFILLLTLGIFISGLLWIYVPLKSALNKPLIPALRAD